LRGELERVWDAGTSTDPDGWTSENPARGHCTVAVLLVQDEFGGRILRGLVGGLSHFWNRLPDGSDVDLTRDQFVVWHVTDVEERSREYVLGTAREDGLTTRDRYATIIRRLADLRDVERRPIR
jgi:hypothetical protein